MYSGAMSVINGYAVSQVANVVFEELGYMIIFSSIRYNANYTILNSLKAIDVIIKYDI